MPRGRPATLEHDGSGRLEVVDPFIPNRKQREFWNVCSRPYSEVEEVLFSGSIRAGKTQSAVKLMVKWALSYKGTYVISRFTRQQLEDSTKKVCLYGEGGLGPAIPSEVLEGGTLDIARNETNNRVRLGNGSEILFRALEPGERGRIRNLTANAWLIDQAEELEGEDIPDFYQELKGRCSMFPHKLLLVANPSYADHFLAKRFIDGMGEPKDRYPKAHHVHVSLWDNRENLDPQWFASQVATKHTNPAYYERLVEGKWGVEAKRRFEWFSEREHLIDPFDIPREWEIVEGGDVGWTDPTCWLWVAIDYDENYYVIAEHYAAKTKVSDHAAQIKRIRLNDPSDEREWIGEGTSLPLPFRGSLEPSATWIDPSAWQTREGDSTAQLFAEHGIYGGRAENARLPGWARLDELGTTLGKDGLRPRLRIFKGCAPNLVRQLKRAKTLPGSDDIEKREDHAIDPARYIVSSRPFAPSKPDEEEEAPVGTRIWVQRKLKRSREQQRQREEPIFPI